MLCVMRRNALVRQGLWLGDMPKNDPTKHLNPIEMEIGLVESAAEDSCVVCTGMGTKQVHLLKNLKVA